MSQPVQSTEAFGLALEFVLDHEGGYVADPRDPGGETRFGISRRAHPDVDIAGLTREEAALIYWEHYWQPAACEALPTPVAIALFDGVVQHGVGLGVRLLQETLPVRVDGINGPRTQAAARAADPRELVARYLTLRIRFYCRLARRDGELYLGGWTRRMLDLLHYTVTLDA